MNQRERDVRQVAHHKRQKHEMIQEEENWLVIHYPKGLER